MTTITAYAHNTITTANGTTAPATYSVNARGTVAITAAVATEDGQKTIRLYIAPDHPDYTAARAAAEPETVTIEAPAPAAVDVAPAEAVTAETPAPVKARKARKAAPAAVEYKGVTLTPNLATIDGVSYPATYEVVHASRTNLAYVRVIAYRADCTESYRAEIAKDCDAEYKAALAIAKKSSAGKCAELIKTARAEAETAAAEVEKPAAEVEPETVETTAAAEVEPETVEATAAAEVEKPAAEAEKNEIARRICTGGAPTSAQRKLLRAVEKQIRENLAAEAVEDVKPATPAAKTPVAKPWVGSTIAGNGWRIVFDEAAQRTRVIFDTPATEKQAAAVAAAGFYWSPTMQSYNKGLKCKAYRAAQELAKTLATVA